MQSSAVVSASGYSHRATPFSRFCSMLTPVHRYSISQDGEIISRGVTRYSFFSFCEENELCELIGESVSVGRCIGYIRDSGTYRIRLLHTDSDNYILLKGPSGDEIFKQIR